MTLPADWTHRPRTCVKRRSSITQCDFSFPAPVGLGGAPHVSYGYQLALMHLVVVNGTCLTINCRIEGVKTFRHWYVKVSLDIAHAWRKLFGD